MNAREELDWLTERIETLRQKKLAKRKGSRLPSLPLSSSSSLVATIKIAQIQNDIGNIFFRRGQYKEALDAYMKTLQESAYDHEVVDDDDDDIGYFYEYDYGDACALEWIHIPPKEDHHPSSSSSPLSPPSSPLPLSPLGDASLNAARITALHNIGVVHYLDGDRSKSLCAFRKAFYLSYQTHQDVVDDSSASYGSSTITTTSSRDLYGMRKPCLSPRDIKKTIETMCRIHIRRGEIDEAMLLCRDARDFGIHLEGFDPLLG